MSPAPELEYEHYFYAPTEAQADALLADLQRGGAIALNPPRLSASDDGSWLVKVVTNYSDYSRDDTMTKRFRALAVEHGGEYDGGGTFVGHVPMDQLPNELRPPADDPLPSWWQRLQRRLWP